MGQLQKDRGQVEHARSTLRTQASRKGVLGALMEQKRSGAIPGIYGRLGDLGAIDDKYNLFSSLVVVVVKMLLLLLLLL